jgi:hemolysin activation/secretion protein
MGSLEGWRYGAEKPCLTAIAAVLAVVCVASAHAQSPAPDPITQEGLRRQEERSRQLREQQTPGADALNPPRSRAAQEPPTAEFPCFVIREVQLEGPGWEGFAWVVDAALPYVRQCVGVRGLARIAESWRTDRGACGGSREIESSAAPHINVIGQQACILICL